MRQLCRRARRCTTPTCSAIRSSRSRACPARRRRCRRAPAPPLNSAYFKRMEAIEFAVKYDDGVGAGARRGGHRPRRRLAHVEDAALDVPRLPRAQDGERADREGIEPPAELFEIEAAKIVGLTIEAERLAEIRHACACARWAAASAATPSWCRSTRSSTRRRACTGGSAARDRRDRPLDRGDRAPDHPLGRAPAPRHRGGRVVTEPPRVSPLRWAVWFAILAARISSSTSSSRRSGSASGPRAGSRTGAGAGSVGSTDGGLPMLDQARICAIVPVSDVDRRGRVLSRRPRAAAGRPERRPAGQSGGGVRGRRRRPLRLQERGRGGGRATEAGFGVDGSRRRQWRGCASGASRSRTTTSRA